MKNLRVRGLGWVLRGLLLLIAFETSVRAATLLWQPNPATENVVFYTVYVESSLGSTSTNVNGTSFPLDQLARGIPYTLKVTATSDANLESAPAVFPFFAPLGPTITRQPDSKFVAASGTLELFVEVAGTPPFSFQWSHNDVVLPAQTNQALLISSVATATAGLYSVRVTNAAGSVISAPATVTILTRPVILLQPLGQTVTAGNRFQLSVTASGSDPLSYQWFRDGQAIAGAQSATYEVLSASSAHVGSYVVQVTNSVGSVQSAAAAITIQAPPIILTQPQSLTVSQGAQIALAVVAAGSPPLQYQWYKGGVALSGKTTAALVIPNSSPADAGTYTVHVTNPYGAIDSNPATVTVQTSSIGPSIVLQPRSVTLGVGGEAHLDVIAAGTAPLFYQWFKDGAALDGETNSTFSLSDAALGDSGSYTLLVSNVVSTTTSNPGILTVLVPPSITTHPSATNIVVGETLLLSVEATGSAPFSYQWYHLGQLVAGATEKTLRIPFVSQQNAGAYLVIVSNGGGAASSTAASVTVTSGGGNPPIIAAHPQGLLLDEGGVGALTVDAGASDGLQFHWFKNGLPLPGQTNAVLDFGSATRADEGEYTVRVSNRYGSVTSDPAVVSVVSLPRILQQPSGVAVRFGNSFQLAVRAASSEALTYQWLKDGVEIPGAVEPNYRVISAQAEHTGTYRVRVSNSEGFILSQEATVTIAIATQITQQPLGITANEGGLLHLTFQASGTGPFVVEWMRDNVLVLVTNVTELTIPEARPSDAGTYVARVTGAGGTAATLPVIVRIETKPVITAQPQGATVGIGANVFLSVSATGNGTLTCQWLRDGQPIAGATNIFLLLSIRGESDYGDYTVRVSNEIGTTESEVALIESATPPSILTQPHNIDVLVGASFALSVDVRGASPHGYQWFRNGAPLSGRTSASLNVALAATSDAGVYHAVVTNAFGSIRSADATVRVIPHIVLTRNLADTNILLGSELTLSVVAASELPLSYSWFHNDDELEGATGSTLQIAQISNAHAGSYYVVVANALEEVQSEVGEVSVILDPGTSAGRLVISAGAGGLTLYGQGEPAATYEIQLCADLKTFNWITIQTVTADVAGRFEIRAPGSGSQWYIRTVRR